ARSAAAERKKPQHTSRTTCASRWWGSSPGRRRRRDGGWGTPARSSRGAKEPPPRRWRRCGRRASKSAKARPTSGRRSLPPSNPLPMPHTERTLTILKPDAVAAGRSGAILAMRRLHLTRAQAEAFYAVHRERGFYQDLVRFMTEGPVLACALERENAVAELRRVMGATDPAKAEAGTVRKLYATSIERNAIHGSDAAATARHEIGFFFAQADLL